MLEMTGRIASVSEPVVSCAVGNRCMSMRRFRLRRLSRLHYGSPTGAQTERREGARWRNGTSRRSSHYGGISRVSMAFYIHRYADQFAAGVQSSIFWSRIPTWMSVGDELDAIRVDRFPGSIDSQSHCNTRLRMIPRRERHGELAMHLDPARGPPAMLARHDKRCIVQCGVHRRAFVVKADRQFDADGVMGN